MQHFVITLSRLAKSQRPARSGVECSVYFRSSATGGLVSARLLSGLSRSSWATTELKYISLSYCPSVHFHPVSRSVRLSFQLEIFGKGPFLKLEKCCGHFWSFSLDWPPYPRLSLIGPKSTNLWIWNVPCLRKAKAKNFRFALGEMEAKEHLNRRSRNPTETVLGNFRFWFSFQFEIRIRTI